MSSYHRRAKLCPYRRRINPPVVLLETSRAVNQPLIHVCCVTFGKIMLRRLTLALSDQDLKEEWRKVPKPGQKTLLWIYCFGCWIKQFLPFRRHVLLLNIETSPKLDLWNTLSLIPLYSPLSHGSHIVPGDQKSFALPRQASQWKPLGWGLAW